MRAANGSGASTAVILGDDELANGTATVKDLRGESEQRVVPLARVAEELAGRGQTG